MIKNKKLWKDYVDKNKDFYSKAVVNVAREVMRLLDDRKHKDFDANNIITEADKNIVIGGGITGFQAGCVAQIVAQCHSKGNEFRKKWNKHYGVDEDKAKGGVVNPAIITLDTSKSSFKVGYGKK